ncbi:N-succinylarginine dihydrolase [Endozoicomonas sp. 8E]|uniref:N-succinylarginine dihydrolase n=1 Tax=Endozoicomonas sp. 8E TaxID=3035692 RepID=UPI0029393EAF|nr:N-succinylarginine dihydrolase [Endozoicomonas sp. 8E]WOG26758.1 N-succinylarginine dihydrolase [Endozoicomonas sp. 8E]
MNKTVEANFDGLVGPTHNYAGLSLGNIASTHHQSAPSNPKQAALQGLAKMKALHDMGLVQGVLAPQERPDVYTLRKLGFSGSDEQVLAEASRQAPTILAACSSASTMWTANAATVSPSADTTSGTVHFTPANLCNKFHRSIEHEITGRILKAVFSSEEHFTHHPALFSTSHFGDEGAANHTRFCQNYGDEGVEFFVYGRYSFDDARPAPTKFPARQTLEASQAVARNHQLNTRRTVFAQQNPEVIDQGVFHNDVIAVGNRNVLFCHEKAFLNQAQVYNDLKNAYGRDDFCIIEVPESQIRVETAVKSYLFNSQLLSTSDRDMTIVVPSDCQSDRQVATYLEGLVASDNPINDIKVFDLRQSMNNGGGPACLRLRVVLTSEELAATNQACLINDTLYTTLCHWVEKHYRDRLTEADLADPELLIESRTALDELTGLLKLGSIYQFQQV